MGRRSGLGKDSLWRMLVSGLTEELSGQHSMIVLSRFGSKTMRRNNRKNQQ